MYASLGPEPFVEHSCNTQDNNTSKGKDPNSHTKPHSRVVLFFSKIGLLLGLVGVAFGNNLCGGEGVSPCQAQRSRFLSASPSSVIALLEGAASAFFTKPGYAVEVVGRHSLILLLNEAEGWKVEAGTLTVSILNHGCEPILGTGYKQVEEAGV